MKRGLIIFFQAVIILSGIGALVFMLWEPLIEGRNAQATLFQVYFHDPFLVYAYTSSIAFFIALYQAFKLLGYVGRKQTFSWPVVKALRIIKYCAVVLVVLIAVPVAYLFIARPDDDIAGGVAIGLVLIFVSAVVAIVATVLGRVVQKR
jgi:MFS superfamily sulfate permease-like transporter